MTTKHFENATKQIEAQGGKLISFAKEFNSEYIYFVIAYFPERYEEWVVWLYNAEFDGLYQGYYTKSEFNAYEKFAEKVRP